MAKNNLFLLFPETERTCQFINSNESFQFQIPVFESFANELNEIINSINVENYVGYYDSQNIENFLLHFKELENLYPDLPRALIRETIKDWDNWRHDTQNIEENSYEIFNQKITNNTFCEIAERKIHNKEDNFPLLNHHAMSVSMRITVLVNSVETIEIYNLSGLKNIQKWFTLNRIPKRNFHTIPKHGENRQEVKIEDGKTISPLRCSVAKAQELLNTAIGFSIDELYQLDNDFDEVIVFKFENDTPQNQYHGYHICKTSSEIPNEIKKRLQIN
jgi:hypothetical protein